MKILFYILVLATLVISSCASSYNFGGEYDDLYYSPSGKPDSRVQNNLPLKGTDKKLKTNKYLEKNRLAEAVPLKKGDIFLNSGISIKYKNLNYLNDSVEFYDQKSLKSKYSLDEIVMITERRDNIGRGFLGGCFVALLPILVKEINPNLEIFKLPLFPAGTYEEMKTKQRNTYIAVGCVTIVTFTLLGAFIGTKEIIYSKGSTSLKFQPDLGINKYSKVYAGITLKFTF